MSFGLDGRGRGGRVVAALARDLLTRNQGDRLPTIVEYARRIGAGHGSIETALRVLHEHGAVRVESRGHLGSFVVAKNAAALWTASGGGAVFGAVPRALSFELEGVVAGLVASFASCGLAFAPLFLSGSRQRVAALLEERVHFIVLSADGAARASREFPVALVCELLETSYYPDDSIVVLTRSDLDDPTQATRVAIDLASYDHELLTRTQFGERDYVDVPYDLIPDRLADRSVDAAVWHRASRSTMVNADRWRLQSVASAETEALHQGMTRAAVVARAEDAPMRALLAATIDPRAIAAAQADARAGRFTPNW